MNLAVGIWGLVFLVFLAILGVRTSNLETATTASRSMPTAHLIQANDLGAGTANSALVGRYLRRPVVMNEMLTPRDVSPTPVLPSNNRPLFPVLVAVDSIRDGSMNAKKAGELCRDLALVAKVEVVAPLCSPAGDATTCIALVQPLPSEDAVKFAVELAKEGLPPIVAKTACKPAK